MLESIRHCQINQGLVIHACVLIPNHLHIIYSFKDEASGGEVLRNMKSFTATKLINAIINNKHESRREWMLDIFESEAAKSSSNSRYKMVEHENHPELLDCSFLYNQKLNYLHENLVTAGFVMEPWY